MQQATDTLERFFRAFESHASSNDVSAQVAQFADVFMAASPQGTQTVHASDFAVALPRKKQLFDRLGCQSTALVSLEERPLDPRYVMASTRWRMTFARNGAKAEDVLVDSIYIVDTGGEAFKIVFYLASQDLMQILRQRGITPD
jgi:hypothetical protein